MFHPTMLRSAQTAAVCLGAALLFPGESAAQNVINSNTTIYSSLCVGFDCANTESYGSDTIRLKENNLRIHFEDTSVGSFPSNDWRIVINSNANGGANFFSINDATTNRHIVNIRAGAPTSSIFVDSSGRVGLKTSTPVVELHLRDGDTPTVRLEQDGSSGFTPQSWDLAGNETNFFIRDVTGGSRLPLRIRPGAPSSSIDIAATGRVGFGTASPQDQIHIRSSGNPGIRIETTGTSLAQWALRTIDASGLFVVRDMVASTNPFRIQAGAPDSAFEVRSDGSIRISALPNCPGIQTNASGVLSCTASPSPAPKTAGTLIIPAGGSRPAATKVATATSSVGVGTATVANGSSSGATSDAASDTCGPGDMAGNWSLVGTNIEKFSANSVLWCDVQLTPAQSRDGSRYSIAGRCRNHAPNDATPEEYSVDGKGSITATSACQIGGSFRIKQGSTVVATANILEGRIEGPAGKKTRAIALSRLPRGRASTIQTFVLQR